LGDAVNQRQGIHVTWSVANDRLTLTWRESGGPVVQPPTRKGFGSLIIAQATDDHGLIEFPPEGVRCIFPIPLRD
jgi:two-component sensor histidine kinase